jgi:MFS family permease
MHYQRLLLLFPQTDPGLSVAWYVILAAAAFLMLVAGARLGQGICTLACVAAGAFLGKMVPSLTGLNWDPSATTVAVGFGGGLFGYLSYRWLTGLGFSLLVVLWTVLGFWMVATTPAKWVWPRYPGGTSAFLPYLQALKNQLGSDFCSQVGPFAVVAFLASLALYTLLPRFSTALFWTVAGLTLAIFTGLAYSHYISPEALQRAPSSFQGQTLTIGTLGLIGMLCQSIRRRPAPPPPPPQPAITVETALA